MSQRILRRRVASGAGEETRRRNRRDLPENETTRKKRKRKAKAGKTGAHPPGRNCPAYGQQCLRRVKYNHYALCCRTGAQPQEGSKETKRERIKKTTEVEETSSDSDDDYIYLQHTAQHLHIGDIDTFVEPDSGASANVMDEYQFKDLKHRSQEIKELEPSRDTLKILQSDLTVKGVFTTTLRNINRSTQSKFLVIQGKMDCPALLSKSTLLELGILKIDPERIPKETNELRIKTVKTPDTATYSNESSAFGEKNTGKKIEVKLDMKTDAKPVAKKPRLYRTTYRNDLKIGWTRE